VEDDEILAAIGELARFTGVFAEPSAATAFAGLRRALDEGVVDREENIVVAVTGTGLKDPGAAGRAIVRPAAIAPTMDAVRERISSWGDSGP
jgi:threonine synthase